MIEKMLEKLAEYGPSYLLLGLVLFWVFRDKRESDSRMNDILTGSLKELNAIMQETGRAAQARYQQIVDNMAHQREEHNKIMTIADGMIERQTRLANDVADVQRKVGEFECRHKD